MRNTSTRQTFETWRRQKGAAAALDRGAFDPAAFGRNLRDIFLLERAADGDFRYRVAGSSICALFGGELRGESFFSTLTHAALADGREILAAATQDVAPVVAGATAIVGDGRGIDSELLVLPMLYAGRTDARILGALHYAAPDRYLLGQCVGLEIVSFRIVCEDDARLVTPGEPPPLPAGQSRRRHLIVHQGGHPGQRG